MNKGMCLRWIIVAAMCSISHAADVYWTSDASGNWGDVSNWSTGQLPTTADRAYIDRPTADPLISMGEMNPNGYRNISQLTIGDRLRISRGVLDVSGTVYLGGSVELFEAHLNAQTVSQTSPGAFISPAAGSVGQMEVSTFDATLLVPPNSVFALNFNTLGANAQVLNNGSLYIGRNVATATLQRIQNNSQLVVTRSWSNTGQVFRLNAGQSLLCWNPSAAVASITGGRLEVDPAADFQLGGGTILENVTIEGKVQADFQIYVKQRMTLDHGTLDVSGINGKLNGTLEFDGNGTVRVGAWDLGQSTTFRSGVTVQTNQTLTGGGIVNQGILEPISNGVLGTSGSQGWVNQGTIRTPVGKSLRIKITPNFQQLGTLDIAEGRMTVDGVFDQNDLGTTIANGGRLIIMNTLDNAGKAFLATPTTTGDVELSNADVNGGVLRSTGGARWIAASGTSRLGIGTALEGNLSITATLDPLDATFHIEPLSELTGGGTILSSVHNKGMISVEGLRVLGDFTQEQGATMRLDMAASASISDVEVQGTSLIGGSVVLHSDSAHKLLPNRSIIAMTSGSLTASALNVVNDTAQSGLILSTVVSSTQLKIQLSAIPGDANTDGIVGFDDLLSLAQWYGSPYSRNWFQGDFTGDNRVRFEDLLLLAQNYGYGLNLQGDDSHADFASDWAMAQQLVPEPAIAFLLLPVVLQGCRSRR